jgi:AraC family transcriptional regulator of adaptative response/methylated-DNA-[protein]-cysteine methyltransferase
VCPARKPLTRNVVYFATPRDAIVAGYRPCKRCDPLNIQGTPPEWIQQLVLEIERDPTTRIADTNLRTRGIDPARVRRYFLKHYGMTFHAYCRGRRMGQALAQIRAGVNLDEVALGNGYESHSGFRDAFTKTFGQAPGKLRRSIS